MTRPHFGGQDVNFRVITLQEPPKNQMIDFLDRESRRQAPGHVPARCARVEVVIQGQEQQNQLFDLLVDLDHHKVIAKQHQAGKHSYIDAAYMQQVERACLSNADVQAEIEKLRLPEGATVVVEPWAYATDGLNDMTQRVTMVRAISLSISREDINTNLIPSVGSISDCWRIRTPITTPILSTSAPKSLNASKSARSIGCQRHQMSGFTMSLALLTNAASIRPQ